MRGFFVRLFFCPNSLVFAHQQKKKSCAVSAPVVLLSRLDNRSVIRCGSDVPLAFLIQLFQPAVKYKGKRPKKVDGLVHFSENPF